MGTFQGGDVRGLLGWVGATVGGAVGWWVGAPVGTFTAFIASIVGTGAGIYLGRWASVRLLD